MTIIRVVKDSHLQFEVIGSEKELSTRLTQDSIENF